MLIDGIGISGYRSFGDECQFIGPFKKVNLFVGQNNSGKSNILLYLAKHYQKALRVLTEKSGASGFQPIDQPQEPLAGKSQLAFGLVPGSEAYESVMQQCEERKASREDLERILMSKTLTHGTQSAWLCYETRGGYSSALVRAKKVVANLRAENVLLDHQWSRLRTQLSEGPRHSEKSEIEEILNWIEQASGLGFPEVALIPAIRRVDASQTPTEDDYSGQGLIEKLARLQNPGYDRQEEKDRFEEICAFLREVTGSDTASLEIPYERDTILVRMDGKTLPLSSLGTGIHEVIILAAAATVLRDWVICVEEPELHLHPLLQKKLVRYMHDKTDNQYFMTTHSAHLLDTPEAAVFHVRLENGQSVVTAADSDTEKSMICADLGYRASDLLQANCVVWVEGPSDRICLNHWIHAVDSDLVEGIHYSIMFYGGRLLSHLSADDPEVEDFISLRRLNRHISIVMDSDRSSPRKHINKTKQRIRDEFNKGPGFAWITKGREIENYVDPQVLEEAVTKVHHPQALGLVATGDYDNRLKCYKTRRGVSERGADKVKVAREVRRHPADLDVLDLKKMISQLVDFIQEANDF